MEQLVLILMNVLIPIISITVLFKQSVLIRMVLFSVVQKVLFEMKTILHNVLISMNVFQILKDIIVPYKSSVLTQLVHSNAVRLVIVPLLIQQTLQIKLVLIWMNVIVIELFLLTNVLEMICALILLDPINAVLKAFALAVCSI